MRGVTKESRTWEVVAQFDPDDEAEVSVNFNGFPVVQLCPGEAMKMADALAGAAQLAAGMVRA